MCTSYRGLDGDPARVGAGSKISRTTASEFQDFSLVFQDLCPLAALSGPGNLKILISGLSRGCTPPLYLQLSTFHHTANTQLVNIANNFAACSVYEQSKTNYAQPVN